jgi:putative PIN family toxin of toxin-antitoxin system
MGKQVRLFLSPPILEEYTEALKPPKFRLDPDAINNFLGDLTRAATMVRPTQRVSNASDEPDNRFLECAQKARVDYIVTGNKRHFPAPAFEGTTIVSRPSLPALLSNGSLVSLNIFSTDRSYERAERY